MPKNPRWMLHKRDDGHNTSLRVAADDDAEKRKFSAVHREIVEVIEPPAKGCKYFKVRLQLTNQEGWLHAGYLHECPEGTADHGRLSSEKKDGDRKVEKVELEPSSSRFKEINAKLQTDSGGKIEVAQVWVINGHFLGETSLRSGPKETHYHGTGSPEVAESICKTGFDDTYSADGKFGPGLYFTPDPLMAYKYACKGTGEYILLCEVALGPEEKRITATERCSDYNWKDLLAQGKRSVQAHKGWIKYEERVVYHCTQCKPVYLMKVQKKEA